MARKRAWLIGVIAAVQIAAVHGQARYVPPRTADGKPDLQGIWQVLNTADVNIQDHAAGSDGPGGQGVGEGDELPHQPWAPAKKQGNFEKRLTADPVRNCYLPARPRRPYLPRP